MEAAQHNRNTGVSKLIGDFVSVENARSESRDGDDVVAGAGNLSGSASGEFVDLPVLRLPVLRRVGGQRQQRKTRQRRDDPPSFDKARQGHTKPPQFGAFHPDTAHG